MCTFIVSKKQIEKLAKISKESGIPIKKQLEMGIEDFLFKYEKAKSPCMKALGEYHHPKIGEFINTDNGEAEVLDVIYFSDIIEELKTDGVPKEEIAFVAVNGSRAAVDVVIREGDEVKLFQLVGGG